MPPKVGSSARDDVDHVLRVALGDLDVEDVDAGEVLEQHRLAFHHRLAGQRADVAEAEHGGAVGDDRDQVAFGSIHVCIIRVLLYLKAGIGHSGSIGQAEIKLGTVRLGRDHFHLTLAAATVIQKRILFSGFWHDNMRFDCERFGIARLLLRN